MFKPKRRTDRKGRYFLESMILVASVLFAAFLIFFCVFSVVYNRTASQLTDDIIAESAQSLSLSAQDVSSAFSREWQLITETDFINDTRSTFSSIHSSNERYARLLSLQKSLGNRFLRSDLFHSVSILFITDEEDYLCSPAFISDDFEHDYKSGLYNFSDMSYEDFISMIQSYAVHRFDRRMFSSGHLDYSYVYGYSANAGYFVYRYTQTSSPMEIYALLQIDLDGLQRTLSSFRYAGDYFMISGNDSVIFTTDETIQLTMDRNGLYSDGLTDTIYLRTSIDKLGLTCFLSIDQNGIYASIANFSQLLQVLSVAFVILTLLLVVLLFLRWHYPVIRIAQHISPDESQDTPIASINSHISNLAYTNALYAQQIENLEPAAHGALLSRFYTGNTLTEKESSLLQALMPLSENASFRCLVVGCLDLPSADRQTLSGTLALLQEHLSNLVAPVVISGQLVVLAQLSEAENADSTVFPTQLKELLFQMNAVSSPEGRLCAIGISDVYMGRASVPAAYREAHMGWVDALNWQNASVVFASATGNSDARYSLSYGQLEDIYRSLKAGDAERAASIFDRIVADNFSPDSGLRLRRLFCQQFFYDILGVLTRLSVHYNIFPVLESLTARNQQLSIDKQLAMLRNALFECAELIPYQDGSGFSSQIQAFCTEHFSDPALSLSMVASHFQLSESNLSKFFKSHTGVTFSSYVENLRIRHAETLLAEGNLSVKAIATRVGYQNVATFYNAFRRNHNCTPTQWLELHKASNPPSE